MPGFLNKFRLKDYKQRLNLLVLMKRMGFLIGYLFLSKHLLKLLFNRVFDTGLTFEWSIFQLFPSRP
jgi:hypothetical protein